MSLVPWSAGKAAVAEGDEQLDEQLDKLEEENLQLIEENSGLINKARAVPIAWPESSRGPRTGYRPAVAAFVCRTAAAHSSIALAAKPNIFAIDLKARQGTAGS